MASPVPFNLKHFETITASMLNWMAGVQSLVTDYNIGSVNRTLLESVAQEIEELYYRLYAAIQAAIPLSTYAAFGFTPNPATAATGQATFSRSTAATLAYDIPAGTRIQTADGVIFQTVADATLAAGSTSVTVSIEAQQAGSAGNVAAGAITLFTGSVIGIEAVTNAAATTGGVDAETDSALAVRFAGYISALARSPINGVMAGAKTVELTDPISGGITEQVRNVQLVEPYLTDSTKPPGVADLYIDNGSGTASQALVDQTQRVIDGYTDSNGNPVIGYKAAGVVVNVRAATAVPVNLTLTVRLQTNAVPATVQTALAASAQAVFAGLSIGDGLDWGALFVALRRTAGVQTLTLSAPAASITGVTGQRVILGTVTVTQG